MAKQNVKLQSTKSQDNLIIDQDTHHHFVIIPHVILDLNLSSSALKLYLHFKRVTGDNGGQCWQSSRSLEKLLSFSRPTIIKAKHELEASGLIKVERAIGDTDIISIVDMWQRNHEAYPKVEKGVVKNIDRGGGKKTLPPVVKKLYPNKNPINKNPIDDDDDIDGLTEFLNFIENNLTKEKLPPHLREKATAIFTNYPGIALEAAKVAVEKGGNSFAYLETVLKNWGKPKPEKPHRLRNYPGKSPADKNMPRGPWPRQSKESELMKRGISPATGKVVGSGFNTF